VKKIYFLWVVGLGILLNSCSSKDSVKITGNVFGTTYSIIYFDNDNNFKKEIENLFSKLNNSLSTYVPSSDISRINNGEKNVKVDAYFKEVFNKSKKIYNETQGYFDPTVGPLVNAWGFGPGKEIKNITQNQIDSLLAFVGFTKVSIQNDLVIKTHPNVYFDFNAIAKGYGIDVVGRFLENKNISNYLVEIGGEIRVRGNKPDGSLWGIEIENPNTDGSRSAYDVVKVTNTSIASSGNYRKYRVSREGEKFVHTINPKTGMATESNLLATTVMANLDCADVDAYATSFMAMGLEKTQQFLSDRPNLKVIFIYADKNGNLQEFRN